ncbi:MAG: transglycosylase domain-containing protein, partial [Actinomycetota bacterium]
MPSWKLVSGLFLTGLAFAVGLFAVGYAATDVPDPNDLVDAQTTTVYYSDGQTAMGEFAAVDRTSVTGDQIPQHVKDAVIAAEDRSFYENRGISPTGIARAFWNNLRGNSTQGGSTITQQYVKNYYLESEQTYSRKIKEAFIAIKVDQQLSKDQILTDYLNTIYFGRGAYGIQSAAQAYFGKNVQDLTPNEAALLAGIIPAPSNWDPAVNPAKAEERYRYVTDGMVAAGAMDSATASQPMPPTVEYAPTDRFAGPTGYLLAAVREEILASTDLTENDLDRGGLRIVSTIAKPAQDAAVAAVQDPEVYPVEGRPETMQAALVSIDPATGAVRAMYGGADYLTRQRNAVTQDIAQAGSTFKPFTLVAALEKGISLRTQYSGASPQEFPGFYTDESGNPQPVRNFGGASYGRMDLVEATENSVNTVYVALNRDAGPEATADVAVRAGIDEEAVTPPNPSNVLGTPSVTPLDMGQAFATFAAQGVRHDPYIVESIEQNGQLVYQREIEDERVIAPDVMADATFAMQQVVESGTGEYAGRLGRPAAGKTGTSNDNRSAWFAGYVPQLATVVALYNVGPNGEQLEMPGFGGRREITGGSFPVQIWTAYMSAALEGTEVIDFPPRADVGE